MGSMFGGLTKAGVSDAGGTKYYDSPVAAEQAISQRVAQSTPLVTPDLSGQRIGEDNPMQFMQASAPKAPTISQPTFQEAQDNPSALTTKGKILSGLLQLGQGAALGAGQRDFGSGFRMAQEFPAEMARRESQNRLLQQEEILKANEAAQQPLMFAANLAKTNASTAEEQSQAALNKKHIDSYDSLIAKRGQTLQDRIDQATAAGLQPNSLEYNKFVYGDTLQPKTPTSGAALDFVAAGTGPQSDQAKTAVENRTKNQIRVKGAQSGGTNPKAQSNVESAAAKYWADANGNLEQASAAVDKDLLAAQGTPQQAAAEANAKAIRQALQSRAKSVKKSAKPQISFSTTGS